ncbi:MAG: Hsp20/alpha crystallin family protein [Bacteroidota bacterium]
MNKEPNKVDDYLRSLKDGLNDIGNKMTKMVDDVFSGEVAATGEVKLVADEFETDDMYVIELEVPGVEKKEVSVQVVDGILIISGARKRNEAFESPRLHRRERRFGEFQRSFTVPAFVELENIKARFDHGVLTIQFPKKVSKTDDSTNIDIE